MRKVPERVCAVTDRLMAETDARLPGQLEGFYLVGSVAQGDYREGYSDVDFVAVLTGRHEAEALSAIHADLAQSFPGLHCDGIYMRAEELAAPAGGVGVRAHEGKIEPRSPEERHAVTWLHLADEGLALRGRRPDADWIAADRDAAIGYSLENLAGYWCKWLNAYRQSPSAMSNPALADRAVTWGALGVARVHATIAGGRVPSKTAAGAYACDVFPRHRRIVNEALRLRAEPERPSHYESALVRRQALIAFMEEVIGSVGREYCEPDAEEHKALTTGNF